MHWSLSVSASEVPFRNVSFVCKAHGPKSAANRQGAASAVLRQGPSGKSWHAADYNCVCCLLLSQGSVQLDVVIDIGVQVPLAPCRSSMFPFRSSDTCAGHVVFCISCCACGSASIESSTGCFLQRWPDALPRTWYGWVSKTSSRLI
jgi:hypothetical protein